MTKRSAPLMLAAMSLGYGVVQLDVTIVNVAINSIGESLHTERTSDCMAGPN